jgi:hypothetical protein
MNVVSSREAKAAIASHLLGTHSANGSVGDVNLHPHQREAVERLVALLDRHRGALLADDVGLGKTYVALAIAAEWAARGERVVVVAPAAIREMWAGAAARSRVDMTFCSVESLSRAGPPAVQPGLVIVDEAHHLRSPTTKRFAAASALCRGASILLLSATPVQNSVDDLRAVLSLFLGTGANGLSIEELARFVVRRLEGAVATPGSSLVLPTVARTVSLGPVSDADCLARILKLPRAVPPRDGDEGGVLLTYTLVRQWASSRAALVTALQRRLARARALDDALASGRLPTRAELNAWTFAEGTQQLAFPEIAAAHEQAAVDDLLNQVREHADGVRDLLAWIGITPDPDDDRARLIREVMARHPGERIVAFSEYAATVTVLYRRLSSTTRVAMLAHAGGRVAGGAISRAEVLDRFGPGASLRAGEAERVDLLLTTDVLSEGVNLQGASVVLHLDLTWNPARLEQRVGRLRRFGAARDSISVYVFAPPAPAERLLHLDERLRIKLGEAARSIGVAGAILPGFDTGGSDASAPREERLTGVLRRWRGATNDTAGPVVAATRARINGALACVRIGDHTVLVVVNPGGISESRAVIERMVDAVLDGDLPVDPTEAHHTRTAVNAWLRRRAVCNAVDLQALRVARSRRALLDRVDLIARRAPRHRQSDLAPLIHAARSAATATMPVGAERVLDELTRCDMSDAAWLHAVGEFAALHARQKAGRAELVALLLLRKSPSEPSVR